eukprot:8648820-Alexandrium_andersonii.AAC.1
MSLIAFFVSLRCEPKPAEGITSRSKIGFGLLRPGLHLGHMHLKEQISTSSADISSFSSLISHTSSDITGKSDKATSGEMAGSA